MGLCDIIKHVSKELQAPLFSPVSKVSDLRAVAWGCSMRLQHGHVVWGYCMGLCDITMHASKEPQAPRFSQASR